MNIQEMMRQAQRMQKKIQKAQEDAATKTVEGSAGGGMVVVSMNGNNEILSIKIEPQVVDPQEIEMLQDLIVAATNQANAAAKAMMREELEKVTGGLPVPGLI
ncbi:MAG: YbaB/EbfC family nucleoid-associated protein [Deltaproteobacteria bacterium]|nr:YbaB/EbfC family nucleoid-associated protein [Deltaproteobacteria bacterium]